MSEQNSITNENPKQVATEEKRFVEDIKQIVATAKTQAYRAVNLMQVASNWLLGWRIVEQEQHGKAKAGLVRGGNLVRCGQPGAANDRERSRALGEECGISL